MKGSRRLKGDIINIEVREGYRKIYKKKLNKSDFKLLAEVFESLMGLGVPILEAMNIVLKKLEKPWFS
ncbi:MAG: hypothetical protein JSW08_02015 [archaeon]|nr:MAG: hypothetical protein JSW08_02015 [archaeon]